MATETTHDHDIHEIADEFDRLCPSQVESTPSDHGHGREAGHMGHEGDDVDTVGWYCASGNVGHPIAEVPHDRIDAMYGRLSTLPDGALDAGGLDALVVECGGRWVV